MEKTIVEFPNYFISDKGVVRNLKSKKVRKPFISDNGYVRIPLFKNNKRCTRALHRVLAISFIPNPNDMPFINHLDGDKQNNDISNLEWCDRSRNMKHAHELGLVKGQTGAKGSKNGSSKLNEDKVLEIRKLASEGFSSKEIAEKFNISRGNCNSIIARKYWKHV
tara:strand:- start:90 stop:584 length:495 start_codon:yes stop_codon:yes gene_type:complete